MKKKADVLKKGFTFSVEKVKENGKNLFRFIGSTEAMDRGGDVVEIEGWELKEFKKNPVILWNHNHGIPPIGRAEKVFRRKESKQLVFDVSFSKKNPMGPVVEGMVEEGILKAVSVGFIPKRHEPMEAKDLPEHLKDMEGVATRFKRQELVELSLTPIGMNQEALRESFDASPVENMLSEVAVLQKSLAKIKDLSSEDEEKHAPKIDEDGEIDLYSEEDAEEKADDDEEEEEEDEEKQVDVKQDEEEEEEEEEEDEKSEEGLVTQALEFDKDFFKDGDEIFKWLSKNGYSATALVERELFHSMSFYPSSFFKRGTKSTEEVSQGVYATKGHLKKSDELFLVATQHYHQLSMDSFRQAIKSEIASVRKCFKEFFDRIDASHLTDLQSSERSSKSKAEDEFAEDLLDNMLSEIRVLEV